VLGNNHSGNSKICNAIKGMTADNAANAPINFSIIVCLDAHLRHPNVPSTTSPTIAIY